MMNTEHQNCSSRRSSRSLAAPCFTAVNTNPNDTRNNTEPTSRPTSRSGSSTRYLKPTPTAHTTNRYGFHFHARVSLWVKHCVNESLTITAAASVAKNSPSVQSHTNLAGPLDKDGDSPTKGPDDEEEDDEDEDDDEDDEDDEDEGDVGTPCRCS